MRQLIAVGTPRGVQGRLRAVVAASRADLLAPGAPRRFIGDRRARFRHSSVARSEHWALCTGAHEMRSPRAAGADQLALKPMLVATGSRISTRHVIRHVRLPLLLRVAEREFASDVTSTLTTTSWFCSSEIV